MPSKTKISNATRVEEIRTLLSKAIHLTNELSDEAHQLAIRKGISEEKSHQHASRHRMAHRLAKGIDALRDLMWELPGVKWD